MGTRMGPNQRATANVLNSQIKIASNSPVLDGLLETISGLLAVLNESRQIVLLNDNFLKTLGIDDPGEVLGLRPGEAVKCRSVKDGSDGCGTAEICANCGAAVALVVAETEDRPAERNCATTVQRDGRIIDLALAVKSHPIRIGDQRFILLFMQDITRQQQRAALERTFFHDINNMISTLVGASELLAEDTSSDLANTLHDAALRIHREVAIQQLLSKSENSSYEPFIDDIDTSTILEDLQIFFRTHPSTYKKNIRYQESYPVLKIRTDFSLLSRVLCNMLINALEASEIDGVVKFWMEETHGDLVFCVWNAGAIEPDIANRIFQRNFSTKGQEGRGLGTFSMKLLGETLLGGHVSFTSNREEGTVFRLKLPMKRSD